MKIAVKYQPNTQCVPLSWYTVEDVYRTHAIEIQEFDPTHQYLEAYCSRCDCELESEELDYIYQTELEDRGSYLEDMEFDDLQDYQNWEHEG